MQTIEGGVSLVREHLVDMLSAHVACARNGSNLAGVEDVFQGDKKGRLGVFKSRLKVVHGLGVVSKPAIKSILIAFGFSAHPDPFGIEANVSLRS